MDRSESGTALKSVDDVLSHYGVIGMHWGSRKLSGPTNVVTTERPGKKLRTTGGKLQPASADAKSVAISKRTAKISTTDALSNKDLQDLVNRLNMEQQYDRLVKGTRDEAGSKFAKRVVKDYGGDAIGVGGAMVIKSHPASKAAFYAIKLGQVLKSNKNNKKKK